MLCKIFRSDNGLPSFLILRFFMCQRSQEKLLLRKLFTEYVRGIPRLAVRRIIHVYSEFGRVSVIRSTSLPTDQATCSIYTSCLQLGVNSSRWPEVITAIYRLFMNNTKKLRALFIHMETREKFLWRHFKTCVFRSYRSSKLCFHRHKWRHTSTNNGVRNVGLVNHNQSSNLHNISIWAMFTIEKVIVKE